MILCMLIILSPFEVLYDCKYPNLLSSIKRFVNFMKKIGLSSPLIVVNVEAQAKGPPYLADDISMHFKFMKQNVVFWLKSHGNMFSFIHLTIHQNCFWWRLGTKHLTNHYLRKRWPYSLTHLRHSAQRVIDALGAHAHACPYQIWKWMNRLKII